MSYKASVPSRVERPFRAAALSFLPFTFNISGDIDQVKELTLEVGGQNLWNTQTITTRDVSPLGIEWPFWSMHNIFLFINGKPGATVTVTDSFRKDTKSKLKAMSTEQQDLTPEGHNPFNISSVQIHSGTLGITFEY